MIGIAALATAARSVIPVGGLYAVKSAAIMALVMSVATWFVHTHHPFDRLGAANQMTTVRAALAALVAGLVGEPSIASVATTAVVVAVIVVMLDGADGWLARRSAHASEFGARFDMEIDALLILALSILVWQHEKAGGWVLLSGLMRYGFVSAGWAARWLARPLPPSRRRQIVCVVQIVALCAALAPIVTVPTSTIVAAVGVLALAASFLIDVVWLWRERAGLQPAPLRLVALGLALVVLNASLAFRNLWPTPAIYWHGALSVEAAVCALAMAFAYWRFGRISPRALTFLGVMWVVLVVGRYADVTAPALYGRPVNLFWDLRHVSAVAAMIARVASWWLVLLIIALAVLIPFILYTLIRWALGQVSDSMTRATERHVLALMAVAVIVLFAAGRVYNLSGFYDDESVLAAAFPAPVSQSLARQARLLVTEMTGFSGTVLGPSPAMDASLANVQGADVLLIFIESYGAVSWQNESLAGRIAAQRAHLEEDIRDTGRDVVSAFVESPTFGGNSWLAHISLLSGLEIRDEDANVLLMRSKRDTLISTFTRRGYRAIAMMPGLQQSWPEGIFYGFNTIYDGQRLDYKGPPFGWWTIPDQFVAARLDALELEPQSRSPVFVFFPTTGTHTPFAPTAPYQPDWHRMLTEQPYLESDIERSWTQEPDWMNLGPSYADALGATYTWIGGLLRRRADRDLVMVLIGDHQPPALVSGEGASWDVPVHVIANRANRANRAHPAGRAAVLDALRAHGFRNGLAPQHPKISKMHELVPILLDAFSGDATQ
jgi:phosphatidylglycerophosphate synthase